MGNKAILVRNLSEEEIEKLKLMASKKKISLNELCLQILKQEVDTTNTNQGKTILIEYFKEIVKTNDILLDVIHKQIKSKKETVEEIKKLQDQYISFVNQIENK
ncbi:hypothetical protein HF867_01125 [Lactobacillus salivarius]|nr:hypothetical protein [Ligilactobacillus salivarius]NME23513.1 hypothetical protein [Ligilactobacillus salivarius]NYA62038.1 hypothetical protein [Ligilactobacillus salivarius]